jgi:2-polyprenyl-3-methyl-5-hydroxy-6-metoxy-1,4-benzoquinol methylase
MSGRHFKDYDKRYRKYWETCKEGFAHISPEKWNKVITPEAMLRNFEVGYKLKEAASVVKDAVVIDYGIGNGRLAVSLFGAGAKKYVGIDIADRQLNRARGFLESQGCKGVYELLKMPVSFADWEPDVFITRGCVQHFPNEKFLNTWCENLNESGAQILMVQYRHTKKGKEFNPHSPKWACRINGRHLAKLLPNYEAEYVSTVELNGYQKSLWVKRS